MKNILKQAIFFIFIGVLSQFYTIRGRATEEIPLRVGYFANITHTQAIIGIEEGRFKKSLGNRVNLTSIVFNAGPSAIEALFGESIDLAYVGPNPAINAWIKSKGQVKVVAGVCSGGVRLIVSKNAGIKSAKDFNGKKLATPQLGNTQDVAARAWLVANGLKPTEKGGTVQILPIKNADQYSLFERGEIDAAWAVEPWASKLIEEAHGSEFLDERSLWPDRKFSTALILVNKKFLVEHPEIVEAWLEEHVKITEWIKTHKAEAQKALNAGLAKLSGKGLPEKVLAKAFDSLEFTVDPIASSLVQSANSAFSLGFLGKESPNLSGLVDLIPLNRILKKNGAALITESGTK